jgi:digeranylgeranylglycerophospholipid reductase
MLKECEVLVVGAGPAGSSAAMAAADGGARTLLIDRKKEIGTPVQCGEVVGETLLRKLKLKLPPGAEAARLDHTTFLLDRRLKLTSREPYWKAVTLERKIFDKALAAQAAEAGAMVHADARLTDIKMDGDRVVQATIMHQGVEVKVHPKVIVAADGVHSTMSRLMDVELFTEKAMAKGIEYEMVSNRRLPMGMQIFLEPEVGLGYGWIIPKGPRRANVGLAAIGLKGNRRDRLQEWLTTNPMLMDLFDVDKVLEVKTGDAPLPGFLGGPIRGNVLFAGDAAGQTLAFVGEGIAPSYACGMGAGAVAAAAVRQNDLSKLSCYERAIEDLLGNELAEGGDIKDSILNVWMDESIPAGDRTVLCGLLMSEVLFPEEVEEARALLSLPPRGMAKAMKDALAKRKARATVSTLGMR